VESLLRGDQYSWLLHNMYGDQPDSWNDNLLGIERYRYIINTFTRMRFCYFDGRLDFKCKKGPTEVDPGPAPLVRAARAPCG
jgi:bis(5'-nucleosyl)-tetraphosphatase (symmetrical)